MLKTIQRMYLNNVKNISSLVLCKICILPLFIYDLSFLTNFSLNRKPNVNKSSL